MKIAVIGGGIGGLTIAYLLAKKKHKIKLFEKSPSLGGLARTTLIDGKQVEVYYHHYDKSHIELFKLCEELDVKVNWFDAKMGYLTNGKIYDFDNVVDLWNFKPLRLRDKFNLAYSYFFQLASNQRVYDTLFKPLLIQKFGDGYDKIAPQWIYSRAKANGRLAYIEGSTQALIDKLRNRILLLDGEIYLGKEYDKDTYDNVIDTSPHNQNMLPITCVVLALDRPLTKYYWLNVGDLSFPFGVVVQRDNIVYLSKYGEAKPDFITPLKRINPDFSEKWIKESQFFKDTYAQDKLPIVDDRGLNNIIKKAYKTTLCI